MQFLLPTWGHGPLYTAPLGCCYGQTRTLGVLPSTQVAAVSINPLHQAKIERNVRHLSGAESDDVRGLFIFYLILYT